MNYTILAAVIASGLSGFGLAWELQAGNISERELGHANDRISATIASRATIERITTTLTAAQNAATTRINNERRLAVIATATSSRVQASADRALRAAAASHESCLERAAALRTVFGSCAAEYQRLGEVAGRLDSDRRLSAAACKNPTVAE